MSKGSISKKENPTPGKGTRKTRKKKKKYLGFSSYSKIELLEKL
jgi:hypothetical protein